MDEVQHHSSVSSDETLSSSNGLDLSKETQRPETSQSNRLIFNPHLPANSSIILDLGIETMKFRRSKFLNPEPDSSCFLSRLSSFSIINSPPRISGTLNNKAKINKNGSESNRDLNDVSVNLSASRTVSGAQSRRILPIFDSNTTSPIAIPLDLRSGGSNQLSMGMTENIINELARNNQEIQLQQNQNDLLPRKRTRYISDEASTLRSCLIVRDNINNPNINLFKDQASTSKHQPLVADSFPFFNHSLSPTSRNKAMVSEIDPQDFNIFKESSSISRYQESSNTSNSTSHLRSITDDYASSSDSYSVEDRERVPFSGYHIGSLPSYASEAHMLLQSVFREMLLYNDESDQWRELSSSFLQVSESFSARNKRVLSLGLITYHSKRLIAEYQKANMHPTGSRKTAKTLILDSFEGLISTVTKTLFSFFSENSILNFDEIISNYEVFRTQYAIYLQHCENNRMQDKDEISRNNLKILKKMIHRLFLTTLTSFRLILMYIGEHLEEKSIELYADKILEEDKIYIKPDS